MPKYVDFLQREGSFSSRLLRKNSVNLTSPDFDGRVIQHNYKNVYFTGPLYMGDKMHKVNVNWDLGSGWLAVSGRGCQNCETENLYDP